MLVFVLQIFGTSLTWANEPNEIINTGDVVISEIKLGGVVEGQPTEYVELFNASDEQINLEGWVVEYAKPTALLTSEDCTKTSWSTIDTSSNIKKAALSGTLDSHTRTVVVIAMNDNAGGSLHVIEVANAVVHDLVGWGKETSMARCSETAQTFTPPNGKSLQRWFMRDDQAIDTNDNQADFHPEPQTSLTGTNPIWQDAPTEEEEIVTPAIECQGIILSEILPNPSGTDTANEFIELHNPTDKSVSLSYCSLQVNSKFYTFAAAMILESGEYHAFTTADLPGLQIVNGGGTVLFVSGDNEYELKYGMADDNVAWVWMDSAWQITYQPTPNLPNVVITDEEEEATLLPDELAPCPPGKFRNPETNRCKTILDTQVLAACDEGQERNPLTNRCRNITEARSSLKPCEPGSVRNTETNRCRKVSVLAASSVKPCDEGEERNPDTNRCRKVSTSSKNSGSIAPTSGGAPHANFGATGLVALGVIGYAVYEYRRDIANLLFQMRTKLLPQK